MAIGDHRYFEVTSVDERRLAHSLGIDGVPNSIAPAPDAAPYVPDKLPEVLRALHARVDALAAEQSNGNSGDGAGPASEEPLDERPTEV
jgi:hypothetical protein